MPDTDLRAVGERIVRYVGGMTDLHAALLQLVNGQIADGDDSEALTTMRNLLEHAEVADTFLGLLLKEVAS